MMSFSESDVDNSSGYDADEWGQYRSLSTLAVVALVLGLCSPLLFVSRLMMVVPLAAVAASLLALKGIAASDGNLSGAGLARCGLALAILFSVASVARVKVRDQLFVNQADYVARQWLSLGAGGRPGGMLRLMTDETVTSMMPGVAPGQAVPFFGQFLATGLLRHDPLFIQVAELPDTASALQLGESEVFPDQIPIVSVRYASKAGFSCRLYLKRFLTRQNEAAWLVDGWELL